MSRTKTLVVLIVSHILAVGMGAGAVFLSLGLDAQRVLRDSNAMLTQVALISRYGLFLDIQRTHAGPAEYREALKRYLAAVQEAAKYPSPFFDEKTLAFDTTLTNERLSRLERELGNVKDAEAYLGAPVEACGKTGWTDCSPDNIARISKKLEAASSFSSATRTTAPK